MNPPPALVAAFVARIDRVLEHLRAELRDAGPAVLVYPSPYWWPREPPTPEAAAAYRAEFYGGLNTPIAGLTRGTAHASPVLWPEGLPLPLTVADALAAVTSGRAALAADLAAELAVMVGDLVPAEWQAGALADPDVIHACALRSMLPEDGATVALDYLLSRVRELPPGETRTRTVGERLAGLAPGALEWTRAVHDARWAVYDAGPDPEPIYVDPVRYGPAAPLNALYRHLWARSPIFAALEAGRLVRELTAPGTDPGPAYMAAVRDALGALAESDALAAAALEVTPDARRRLHGFPVELLDAARKVAALFAVDPAADDAARATVETPHGPALRWDVDFAAVGLTAERADTVRENAAGRWAAVYGPQVPIPDTPRPLAGSLWNMWTDERWLRWLAAELWATVWKPRALFEQAKRAAAMPLLLRRDLRRIRTGVNVSAAERGGFEYLALDGTTVARFSAPALNRKQLAAMQRGVKHLRGMLFERVSRGLVRDCFEQAAAGVNPFTRLTWPHGFEGVATAYGINSKDRARLPELFEAMHAYRGSDRIIPPLIGGFWLTGATRGRAAELRCDVGEALAPGYASVVAGMPNTARGDEWLLPVLPVPLLALEGTAAGDYGALCDLQWELLTLFRERAEEGRDRGGWLLSDADRAAVVDRAELRSKLAGAWLTPWTTGPRAWLRELPGGRLALVDEDAAELLRDAANYTTTARNRGKRTKAKKMKLR